jgi:hypothetical protein
VCERRLRTSFAQWTLCILDEVDYVIARPALKIDCRATKQLFNLPGCWRVAQGGVIEKLQDSLGFILRHVANKLFESLGSGEFLYADLSAGSIAMMDTFSRWLVRFGPVSSPQTPGEPFPVNAETARAAISRSWIGAVRASGW